jgi:hypothetical protein
MKDAASAPSRIAWIASLLGLGLVTFATVGLSGPGRIDIVDGQTRFEVGRSLVEHGDSALRDERIWWGSFPGRDGLQFCYYRFPQSIVAAGAILAADATGTRSEGRRHFFFVLSGAVAAGLLSILYAIWFRRGGCRPAAALLWAAGGIFCTPTWFYATSTFDEYLGTTCLIALLLAAQLTRGQAWGAVLTGLLLGLSYNVKQPLAAFGAVALAVHDEPAKPWRQRFVNAIIIVGGLLAGVMSEIAYDRIKFPFDKYEAHAELLKAYGPVYANHPFAAAAGLTVSPGAGAIWYFPPLLLCLIGVGVRWKDDRRLVIALLIAIIPYVGFFCAMSFFTGDPAWGPRYLTPLFGVLWLFAPAGATKLRRPLVALLLGLGVLVQLLALSVDHHRLYVQLDASSGFGRLHPWLYFEPALSHLLNRPREIAEIVRDHPGAEEFTPAPAPTFAFPLLDPPRDGERRQYLEKRGPDVVLKYRVLNSFRPWWASVPWLVPEDRPVNLGKFAAFLLGVMCAGQILLGLSIPGPRRA